MAAGENFSLSVSSVRGTGSTGGPGDIAISSFSWGTTKSLGTCVGCARGVGASTKNLPIKFTRRIDKVSPTFQEVCATGRILKTVVLYIVPSKCADGSTGADDSATVTFSNARIVSDSWTGVTTSAPVENLTMNYVRESVTYTTTPPTTTSTTTTVYFPPPTLPQ